MKFEYFLIIFLINSIKADEIVFEFKHTDFFQLINNNYILCTEKGIYLYDSKLKNKISEHNFTTEVSSSK
jgi:parallel beta-helix repeat protein